MSNSDAGRSLFGRRGSRSGIEALEQRIEALSDQLAEQRKVQARQRKRIEEQAERLQRQAERLQRQSERIKVIEDSDVVMAQPILASQLSTMEMRLEDLEVRHEKAPDSTEPERAEARNLLDEVRDEHRQVKARFGVVTRYEERVRRLERAIEPEPGM
jgi:uncharacterized coiled-coil protein SlyX